MAGPTRPSAPGPDDGGAPSRETIGPPAVRPSSPDPVDRATLASRYEPVRELGRGGMGRVLLVRDTRLGRPVALKMQLADASEARAWLRFLEEARATAQLEHPSIVPVYELDPTGDPAPYFTMRYVEGRSLAAVLAELRAGDAATCEAFGPAELLLVFLKVCDAVAYAHDRGVLHRDLKPDNVMLGRFGEVFVMDWGLALIGAERRRRAASTPPEHDASAPPPPPEQSDPNAVSSVRETADGVADALTLNGTLVGTPGYMAPEQIRADAAAIDARSDVFALGAILYEMLTLAPAIEGGNAIARLANALLAPVVPPRRRAPGRAISPALEAVVLRALASEPDARYPSVMALREAVAHELEGSRAAARRRAAAEAKLASARGHLARASAQRAVHDARLAEGARQRTALADAPAGAAALPARQALWQSEAAAERALAAARQAFWEAFGALRGALEDDPEFDPARATLVEVLLDRAEEMHRAGEGEAAADLTAMARQLDPARVAARLDAPGSLAITPVPAAVVERATRVRVLRCEDEGPLRVEVPHADLGTAPRALAVPPGSYVVELECEGRARARVPVVVAPGASVTREVWLPPAHALAAGFVYVPAGRYVVGGDARAPGAEPRREVDVGAFAIARHPVTMREYAAFLNAVRAARGAAAAAAHAPRVQRATYWAPDPRDGVYRTPWRDPDGDTLEAEHPVFMVSCEDGEAYAAWAATRVGQPLRLPTSDEWEIAARGADERVFPWGNGFDPALCWMRDTDPTAVMHPCLVGQHPLDRSVFGALDMAGLVREWTSTRTEDERGVVRGGAYQSTIEQCRIGRVTRPRSGQIGITFGFRVAYSLGAA